MGKVINCSVIIYDDFNNILVAERGKGKKDSPKLWGIFGRALRGKEDAETCISKVIDKELGCTVFDLTLLKEYTVDAEADSTYLVLRGRIREMVSLHKDINKVKWIGPRELENLQFDDGDREVISYFFSNSK